MIVFRRCYTYGVVWSYYNFEFRGDDDFRMLHPVPFCERLKDAEEVIRQLATSKIGTRNLIALVEQRWRQCEQPLMLLAVILHPIHVKAGKKLLNKTPLTTVGSIFRIGVYYYSRFTSKDPGGLGRDWHLWLKGRTASPPPGFGSISEFWEFMRDDLPGSKLPTLALLQAEKNSVEKAKKITAVRKKVREANCLDADLKSVRVKKLTNPTERSIRHDDRFECNQADAEEDTEDESRSDLGSEDAFEYWGAALAELEGGDEDLPMSNHLSDISTTVLVDEDLDETTKEREFKEKVEEIAEQAAASNPEPIKHP
ncbi:Hypothetical protein PHPALM_3173 [Phytophthora palmivora]|uniref:Uncharacterized protein n=1 Tax=Phytophthora palmivora TaxID=4796 RepID=A0A2P4YN58_9STRA|nr:Hypothetical protein PHPALM_3173 [Phytophthora palmivora]